MGRRSGPESGARAIGLFLERPIWVQSELAAELGLTVEATRSVLRSLQDAQIPLTSERKGPRVEWTLKEGWLAGSVRITKARLPEFYALVLSAPRAPGRERFLRQMLAAGGWSDKAVDAVVPAEMSDKVDGYLRTILEAAQRRQCLRIRYWSQHSGDLSWRDVSPQRVENDGTPRVIAWCHRSGELKVFRVDRIEDAAPRPAAVFREVDDATIEEFRRGGVNGYRNTERVAFWFEFRIADRWIKDNLPSMVTSEQEQRGEVLRIAGEVAGLTILARYVAGIGEHVTGMDLGLAAAVRAVAQGALDAATRALNADAVSSNDVDAVARIAGSGGSTVGGE